MEKIKVFVVGPSVGYSRFIENKELVNNIEEAEVVLFTGGEDINPSLYNKRAHHSTWYTQSRDDFEVENYKKVREDQLIVGICRGAQLACALNGGILIQDCNGHGGCRHNITNGVETYEIQSIHHQMMYPWDMPKEDYSILFWSDKKRSKTYEGDGVDPSKVSCEPEIIMFHKKGHPKTLAIQGHPEMSMDSNVVDMINTIIRENIC